VPGPTSKRYRAALGFALKDRTPPDNHAGLRALSTAIELRGDPSTERKEFHEFARAIVRLRLAGPGELDETTRLAG
jgi:hypothetical protein